MRSAADIIQTLGGSTAVAAALKIPATTVASWKSRNSIPAVHWFAVVETARANGAEAVTFEELAEMAAASASDTVQPEREKQAS